MTGYIGIQERLRIAARVAVCGHCKLRSDPMYGATIRNHIGPGLRALGWRLRRPGGWTCPKCVALTPLQIAEE